MPSFRVSPDDIRDVSAHVVTSIGEDVAAFQRRTLQAADTYQAMEDSNTAVAERFAGEI